MDPHLVAALNAANHFLGGANLGHFPGDRGGQLADLRIGAGKDGGGNRLRSKLGNGQHLQKTRSSCDAVSTFPPYSKQTASEKKLQRLR